jgi:hypothetical protein
MNETAPFYARLPSMKSAGDALNESNYATVPDDWLIAVSDIKGSTQAVAKGQGANVNFAAAAMIASLTNLVGPLPHQFGGDGAVALVPPGHDAEARKVLARTRAFAKREFGLDQRVGLVAVAALAERGVGLAVAKYEPAPGMAYAAFRGGGIELLEKSVKGRGDATLESLAAIPAELDDGEPPDLTGLSCRWTPIKAARGQIVSLVARGADHATLHAELAVVAGVPSLNAVSIAGLKPRWPPKGLMREARARHKKGSLAVMTLKVAAETLLAYFFVKNGWKAGTFDAKRYTQEVADGAVDFARSDDTLYMVFDCPAERVALVRDFLDDRAKAGRLRYGMSLSDHAVMACLVVSMTDGRHVHFVDGGEGGYTRAATEMKGKPA